MSKDVDEVLDQFDDVVTLVDEEGKEVRFEHLYTLEYEGDLYALLSPIDEVEGVEEDEAIILRIEHGEGEDDDQYVSVEDEGLLDRVFAEYLKIAQAEEEADEEEEDRD